MSRDGPEFVAVRETTERASIAISDGFVAAHLEVHRWDGAASRRAEADGKTL